MLYKWYKYWTDYNSVPFIGTLVVVDTLRRPPSAGLEATALSDLHILRSDTNALELGLLPHPYSGPFMFYGL